ncbi:LANO_0F15214g1_1 [Lachancea nothofagi CBS 11611]|uniref:LANO_0F15214g1_1 n=1 Tax=Lachancea nothofagi CBS 11611 TaxID=1266666 RepID=A0A1G4KCN2_9SACH|nr:LANO_0F15214g1_1 [Lachancea nothofagi CBS 11611]
MFQSFENERFIGGSTAGNGLKRDLQYDNEPTPIQHDSKRQKKTGESQLREQDFSSRRESFPLIDDTLEAIAMNSRQNTCESNDSSPYVEIEDYILKGYGSSLINGGYNTRLSLDNITSVNYCLYDMDAEEEFDDSEYGGVSDGKTLVETPEPQDVVME